MKKMFLLTALMMSTAMPLAAQQATPSPVNPPDLAQSPPLFSNETTFIPTPGVERPKPFGFETVSDLVYKGSDDVDDFWIVKGQDYVVSRNRTTGVVRIGYVFGPTGMDMSALLTGKPEITVQNVIDSHTHPETPTLLSQQGEDPIPLTPLEPEPVLEEHDNVLLEKAPEAVRNELLARLVERLEKTTTSEEYKNEILRWREEVRKELSSAPSADTTKAIVDDLMKSMDAERSAANPLEQKIEQGQTPLPPITSSGTVTQPIEGQGVQPQVSTPPTPGGLVIGNDQAGTQTTAADEASHTYAVLSQDSRWFSVGKVGAPVIYIVVDPTCPFCSRALTDMENAVKSGQAELRIVIAPLLSPKSSETIAGILLSDDPDAALFENARARADGQGKTVTPRNLTDLPQDVQADLMHNRQNVIDLGINQIPFFAWETANGYKTLAGVPGADDFRGDNAPLAEE